MGINVAITALALAHSPGKAGGGETMLLAEQEQPAPTPMARILKLPDHVIAKIAAGEVGRVVAVC